MNWERQLLLARLDLRLLLLRFDESSVEPGTEPSLLAALRQERIQVLRSQVGKIEQSLWASRHQRANEEELHERFGLSRWDAHTLLRLAQEGESQLDLAERLRRVGECWGRLRYRSDGGFLGNGHFESGDAPLETAIVVALASLSVEGSAASWMEMEPRAAELLEALAFESSSAELTPAERSLAS